MSESRHHNLSCTSHPNASEIIDNVKNKIEGCMVKYMSLEETMKNLQDNHQILPDITKLIWDRLKRENPDFFKNYDLKRQVARQTKMFNGLLAKQAALMLEHGKLRVSTAPPDRSEAVSHSSLALPVTNRPTEISNDQQTPVNLNQCSTPNEPACTYVGPPTIAPAATDQRSPSNNLACKENTEFSTVAPAATVGVPTVAPAATAQWSSSNDLAYIGAPTFAQAATTPCDLSTFEFGDSFEHNGLNFQHMDPLVAQLPLLPDLYGQSQPQLQNFSPEEQQSLLYGGIMNRLQNGGRYNTLQYGGSNNMPQSGGSNNGLRYGGHYNRLQYEKRNNTLQYGGNNNTLQNVGSINTLQNVGSINGLQGVIPHHHHQEQDLTIQAQGEPLFQIPESEAPNNPNSGHSTLIMAQNQQRQQGRRGP